MTARSDRSPQRRVLTAAALALGVAALAVPATAAPPPVTSAPPTEGSSGSGAPVYKVTVTGKYRAQPCVGRMRLTYKVQGVKPFRRLAKLGRDCKYEKTIRLQVSSSTRLPAVLKVKQRYLGSKKFPPGDSQTLRVVLQAP